MPITSSQLRQKYLDFFRSKNHAIVPSAPLVPENDASVLFNTAGMQPMVPYLMGEKHPMGVRIANVQKCIRTVDIDGVGDDTHCTFFEMLGNWSLGDYFKKESLTWSWEFLTSPDWLGLNPRMLSVTVFQGDASTPCDEEAIQIWKDIWVKNGLDFGDEKIARLPAEDNWWAAGPTGPCGPDSEIFYWVGEGEPQGNKGTHDKEWMEIWNNVFMEFNRKEIKKTILLDGMFCLFDENFVVNEDVMHRIQGLGRRVIVVTNAPTGKLLSVAEKTGFEIVTYEKNPIKTDPEFFKKLLADKNLTPEDCVCLDHDSENLASAARVGIKGELFVESDSCGLLKNHFFILEPLPAKNIDTGMGLERTLAVLNNKKSVYHTDLFESVIEHIRGIVEGNQETSSTLLETSSPPVAGQTPTLLLPADDGTGAGEGGVTGIENVHLSEPHPQPFSSVSSQSSEPHPQPFSSQEKGVATGWQIAKKDWENYEITKPEIIRRAQELRKTATSAEQIVWEMLRDRQFLGFKFRRQHPISQYIADFYCAELNLVVELDGSIHETEDQKKYDQERDIFMQKMSITVLRFGNEEVYNEKAFLDKLQSLISPLLAVAVPSPARRELGGGFKKGQSGRELGGGSQGIYTEHSARIIADHLRTAVHMIADGVKPSNTDRGYILRRLLRRAIREAHKMGHEEACLAEIARDFIRIYENVYESVRNNETVIIDEITMEETKFQKTLKQGIREFDKLFEKRKFTNKDIQVGSIFPIDKTMETVTVKDFSFFSSFSGDDAFYLFETYGFPVEMTLELLEERSYECNSDYAKDNILNTFEESFKKHQDLSRTASAGMFKGGLADHSDITISLHTACHLMLAGLRKVLGTHVMQAGSNITPERLRFDFTHSEKMTPEQIQQVEDFVNGALQSHLTVTMTEEAKESARARGVLGAFWEKYPETVKVYTMVGDDGVVYSEELCGGPHVEESSKMGTFKIQKEEASSAGVRRIKAILSL